MIPGSASQCLLKVNSNGNLTRQSFVLMCVVSFYYIVSFLLKCRLTVDLVDISSFSCTFYCKNLIRNLIVRDLISTKKQVKGEPDLLY